MMKVMSRSGESMEPMDEVPLKELGESELERYRHRYRYRFIQRYRFIERMKVKTITRSV